MTNAKRGADPDPQRAGEKRKSKEEQIENRDKRTRLGDSKGPRVSQNSYSGYTPLSVLKEQLLKQIRDLDLLWKPKEIRTAPNQRDKSKYCRSHKDHGHNTNDCFNLKEEIESLIQQGYLKDFIKRKEHRDIQNEVSADVPQNIATVAPDHIENQEVVGGAPIRTIFGGLAGGGDSNKARKAYVREVRATPGALLVNLVGKPLKETRMEYNTMTFIEEEGRMIHQPHDDALVISITLANRKVFRVLVDNGSSADILYAAAFNKMNIRNEKLKRICTLLIDFGGECLIPLGNTDLPVTIGEPPH